MDFEPETTRPISRQGKLGCGTPVEVRNHFISSWSRGFEVAEVDRDGYRLRRVSDRVVLPATFSPDEVRTRA
jgi:hypothetical protein